MLVSMLVTILSMYEAASTHGQILHQINFANGMHRDLLVAENRRIRFVISEGEPLWDGEGEDQWEGYRITWRPDSQALVQGKYNFSTHWIPDAFEELVRYFDQYEIDDETRKHIFEDFSSRLIHQQPTKDFETGPEGIWVDHWKNDRIWIYQRE